MTLVGVTTRVTPYSEADYVNQIDDSLPLLLPPARFVIVESTHCCWLMRGVAPFLHTPRTYRKEEKKRRRRLCEWWRGGRERKIITTPVQICVLDCY